MSIRSALKKWDKWTEKEDVFILYYLKVLLTFALPLVIILFTILATISWLVLK
jgi:hypothetical protein